MKKLVFTLVAAVFLGSLFGDLSAKSIPEKDTKKCCLKIKREVRKALRGPSFDYLQPECFEKATVYLAVNDKNEVQVIKIKSQNKQLIDYIKKTIKEKHIKSNSKLVGKMLILDIDFYHQPS
nr:hypothetical protein [uncultured Carboxylicivirga sp.]